jgi:hypothetical protein
MIPAEHLKKIIDNLGKNGDRAWLYINDYQHEVANARDENGLSLLAHAIKMNDGGNVTYLLRLGADMNAPAKDGGSMSHYEYAEKYATYGGRAPFAFEALQSFKKLKDELKVSIMPDQACDIDQEQKKSWYENAKNKNDDDLVSLYHGTKTYTVNEETVQSIKEGFLKTNCIQECSGPTLSIKPIGQFWMGIGFEIQIPRSQIEFPGETKENPLIKVNEDSVAFIMNKERNIKFDDYRSKILLNLRCCNPETEVMPTYRTEDSKVGNYAGKFNLDEKTIAALNEVQELMEVNHNKVLQKEQKLKSISSIDRIREKSLGNTSASNSFKYA